MFLRDQVPWRPSRPASHCSTRSCVGGAPLTCSVCPVSGGVRVTDGMTPDIKTRKRKPVCGAHQHERAVIPSLFLSLLPLLLPIVPWVGLLVVNSWFPSNQPGMSRTASTFLCVSDRAATLSSGAFHVDTESPPILTSPVKGRGKDDVVSPVARSCLILQTLP